MRVWERAFRFDRPRAAVLVGLPLLAGTVLGANQTRAGAYMPWALSIVYWIVISLATWWLFALATQFVRTLTKPWTPPEWTVWLFGAVIGSFAARPTIYAIVAAFRPVMDAPVLREMAPARPDASFLVYYLTNWSVIIAMWVIACWWLSTVARRPSALPDECAALPARPAQSLHGLMARLPVGIGHQVIALQAEDHYVRIHTCLGNALLLGSLSDAIEDVRASGIDGQRTHRSWWVAEGAVTDKRQSGRQLHLVLQTGIEVPVSVTYRQLAIAGGLLVA